MDFAPLRQEGFAGRLRRKDFASLRQAQNGCGRQDAMTVRSAEGHPVDDPPAGAVTSSAGAMFQIATVSAQAAPCATR